MRAKSGFTLVEILIVVVILGILAAVVIPQFTNASVDAKISGVRSDLQTVRSQIQLYKFNNDAYPTLAGFTTAMVPTYLQAVPTNPFTSSSARSALNVTTAGWVYIEGTGAFNACDSATQDLYDEY